MRKPHQFCNYDPVPAQPISGNLARAALGNACPGLRQQLPWGRPVQRWTRCMDNWSHLFPRLTDFHILFTHVTVHLRACHLSPVHKNSGSEGNAVKNSGIVRPAGPFPTPTSQRFLWGAMSSLRGLWGGHQGAEHSGHMGNDQFNNLCLDPTWNQTPAPHPSHPLTTHPFTARAWHPRHNRSVQ